MFDLWVVLFPILLTDIINPVLFAAAVYAIGTSRPYANSIALLLGHTVAYFTAGVIIAVGLERITQRLANPESSDYVISLIIGIALLGAAFAMLRDGGNTSDPGEKMSELTPLKAFGTGAIVNLIGMPFALPYFAAISQILKADLSATGSTLMVAAYSTLYAVPFLIVPILAAALGDRSKFILDKLNSGLNKASAFIMPPLLALIGIALGIDALRFMLTGQGLF